MHGRHYGVVIGTEHESGKAAAARAYFAFLNDLANGFRTMTLPFGGGFELSVRCSG